MNPEQLLSYFDLISDAPDAISLLRRFIIDLAVRGKLLKQSADDEPASALVKRMEAEKAKLVIAGKVKKDKRLPPLAQEDLPFRIPSSWAWIRVGEGFIYDAGVKREPRELLAERWLLELEDIERDTSVVLARLTVKDRDSRSTKSEFEKGDILYGKLRPYLNKVVAAKEPGYSTTEIVAIRPLVPLCAEYCCLAFRRPDFVAYVDRVGQGTKMPRLRTPDAITAVFPLPPLAEQRRIAAKFEELMSLCDELAATQAARESRREKLVVASLRRLSQPSNDTHVFREHARFCLHHLPHLTARAENVKQLREAILNLAVQGRLVSHCAEDEPASELLKSIKSKKEMLLKSGHLKKDKDIWEGTPKEPPYKLPSNWAWSCLQDTFEISRGGSPRPAGDPRYFGGPIPWITVREITKDEGKYLVSTEGSLTKEGAARSRFVKPGDLLLTNSGATLGVPKISSIKGCINDGVAILRAFHSVPLNDFVYLYLASQTHLFRQVNQGMGQPNLNTQIIAGWFLPLPPLAEQHRIVAKVEQIMALCDCLEGQLATVPSESRRLLEVLLKEAFDDTHRFDDGASHFFGEF